MEKSKYEFLGQALGAVGCSNVNNLIGSRVIFDIPGPGAQENIYMGTIAGVGVSTLRGFDAPRQEIRLVVYDVPLNSKSHLECLFFRDGQWYTHLRHPEGKLFQSLTHITLFLPRTPVLGRGTNYIEFVPPSR